MSIIRTENLEKTYQDNGVPVKALRSVSMTIEPGEFTVIAGPSGSGKTTLLNLIGALDVPTAGTVMLENAVLAELSRDQLSDLRLRKIGFVFQAYNLIPVLSAIENVEFTMVLSGVSEKDRTERAMKVLNELGIGELANKRP
ncbi:MAG: ATP-binding cassette domain-containing protein, partial [Calditrichaeota bacterium]|nr:ATP-binding cassette domain-containing protein [Calditrichota bacterium]